MSKKTLFLIFSLSFSSIILASSLALLDLYGFLDGRHALNLALLIIALVGCYTIVIIVFLLEFCSEKDLTAICLMVSIAFSIVFFVINKNPLTASIISPFFFFFLFYIYHTSLARYKIFAKFMPRDILDPVVKRSFIFLLIFFALISFFRVSKRISQNTLVTSPLLKVVEVPIVTTLSNYFSRELKHELKDKFPGKISKEDQKKVVVLFLTETVKSLSDEKTGLIYGFPVYKIPIEKTAVFDNWRIDLAPVADSILPEIAQMINEKVSNNFFIVPLLIALLTFIILQPFSLLIYPISLLYITLAFSILKSTGFAKVVKQQAEVERLVL